MTLIHDFFRFSTKVQRVLIQGGQQSTICLFFVYFGRIPNTRWALTHVYFTISSFFCNIKRRDKHEILKSKSIWYIIFFYHFDQGGLYQVPIFIIRGIYTKPYLYAPEVSFKNGAVTLGSSNASTLASTPIWYCLGPFSSTTTLQGARASGTVIINFGLLG